MLERVNLRTSLAYAVAAAFAVGAASGGGVAFAGGPAGPAPEAVGGPALAGRGVIVSYPSRSAPRLPGIQASAFVVADADTGQVLAAKDPHGWYRPASTLKVLTAVSLLPVLTRTPRWWPPSRPRWSRRTWSASWPATLT